MFFENLIRLFKRWKSTLSNLPATGTLILPFYPIVSPGLSHQEAAQQQVAAVKA
jgi:hypothetical protein